MKYFAALSVALFTSFSLLSAQNQGPQTPEQREKQILEYIDKEVKRLSSMLELEYWQEFYVDSTLTHDIHARAEEMEQMQKSKVGNADLYQDIWDRWEEQIARTYQRFFSEEQWKKYLKSGGARAQKERDKRRAKAEKAASALKNEGK